ncbi:uncharacterized protein [Solanum lycopersicum]|uniref:uncharacterized protein n=1 Tax=Solanum lycopersicum TaxID=4081 RepID=UPI003749643E
MVDFMNIRQEGMSVKDYSLKFTQISKYAPAMVSNPRDRMNKFVMGVFSLVERSFVRQCSLMKWISLAKIMVYAQKIESKIREIMQEGKRPKFDESIQPKPKKRFYHQESSMGEKDRVSNKNSQGGGHTCERPRCATCGKQHLGKCLVGTNGYFACSSKNHKMRECPKIKEKGKEINQAPQGGLDPNAPKKNPPYGMGARRENKSGIDSPGKP